MDLKVTRKIIDAIHDGSLSKIRTEPSKIFGLHVPESCPGVETRILDPENTWSDKVNLINLKFFIIISIFR